MTSRIVLLLLLAGLSACRSDAPKTASTYETAPTQSRGDTEKARALNDLAIEQIDRGEFAEAEDTLKRALSADVMFGPAHNNLGKVYFEQGRYYLAAWEFQYAIKCMPNHPEPRNNLGLVYEQAQQLDKAVTYYREALDIEPDNVEILGNLARACIERGDRDEQLRQLLTDLLFKDTRPAWRAWAEEKLSHLGGPAQEPG